MVSIYEDAAPTIRALRQEKQLYDRDKRFGVTKSFMIFKINNNEVIG